MQLPTNKQKIRGNFSGDDYVIFNNQKTPPKSELINGMFNIISESNCGVVICDPVKKESFLQKIEKRILGLEQSSDVDLMVIKKDILSYVNKDISKKVNFTQLALYIAKEIGFETIKGTEFTEIVNSKNLSFKKQIENIFSAIKIKFLVDKTFLIRNVDNSAIGSGVIFRGKKYITHSKLSLSKSATVTFTRWQKIVAALLLSSLIFGFLVNPLQTAIILIGVLTVIYFTDVLFNLFIIFKSLQHPPEIVIKQEEVDALDDNSLPIYSVLCPLYKESAVLPQFLNSINKLNWPKNKLDVLLLLEEDDQETIEAAKKIKLPEYIRTIIVPKSYPKTKPKACNYGLQLAKGKYLVIYDAEDIPDEQQLKKAYLSFKRVDPDVICLQAKLNYYNSSQNLLTRLFTAEYSLWFDIVLPGLQSINTIIPLGGTSNHFKTKILLSLHGWDAFNVTEDCDLGARLFKENYKTAIFDSTTFEEANSHLKNWIRQRSRWIKGYLQTYLVHTRDFPKFVKRYKIHALIFQLVVGLRISFILINPVLWLTTLSYFLFYPYVGRTIEMLYPTVIFYMAVISLILGNFMYLYNYMIGLAKKGQWSIIKFVFVVPFYWLLMSFSAIIAFYQLVFNPYFWEKTVHGLHIKKKKAKKITNNFENILELIKGKRNLELKPSPSKIKVLIFNWYDIKHMWAGGAEIYIHNISKFLVKNGYEVTIFCGNDKHNPKHETIDGINIVRKGGLFTVVIWGFIYYIFKFRGKFDAIIDAAKGVSFFTPLYVKSPTIGLLFHIHSDMFKNGLKFPLKELAVFLERKLMPLVYKNSEMVTISESSKLAMEKLGFGKNVPIEIITPGAEVKRFDIKKTPYPSLIYLGRLRGYKKVDLIIQAVDKLKNKYSNVKLTIAGSGENEYYLKSLTQELNLNKHVVFTGRVSESDKAKILSESWVAVQPSISEGWGITNIEANKCGTPVIASDTDGLKDSVISGKTGLLFEPNNVEALIREVDKVLSSESLRKEMEINAIRWANNFSWETSGILFSEKIRQISIPNKNYPLEEALEGL